MSTWISKAFAACVLVGLAACQDISPSAPDQRSIRVLSGDVTISAPAGYCPNPKLGESAAADTAVVLMGRCNASSTAAAALITATIGAAGSGAALNAGPVALTNFFTSAQGRAMLSSSGKASDLQVISSQIEGDALLLQVNDARFGVYWRGVFALRGRLVMLSVTGAQDLTAAQSRALVSKSILSLRKANGEAANQNLFAPQTASVAAP